MLAAPHLLLIGGAPGVGKSTVARQLQHRLSSSIWLDADDLWRMSPWRVDAQTITMVEESIIAVLREQLRGGFEHVILTWVMHKPEIAATILGGLADTPHVAHHITLVCDASALTERFLADPGRGEITALARERLRQTRDLPGVIIDTTEMTPAQVAEAILNITTSPAP